MKKIEVRMYWLPIEMVTSDVNAGNDNFIDMAESIGNVCTLQKFTELVNGGNIDLNGFIVVSKEFDITETNKENYKDIIAKEAEKEEFSNGLCGAYLDNLINVWQKMEDQSEKKLMLYYIHAMELVNYEAGHSEGLYDMTTKDYIDISFKAMDYFKENGTEEDIFDDEGTLELIYKELEKF